MQSFVMAPVELDDQVRYAPLAVALLHGASVVYLTYTISTNLYRSRAQVRPSQNTRHRSEKRGKIVPVLAALAAFSFFVAEYFAFGAALASYRAWRHEQRPASTWLGPAGYSHGGLGLDMIRWLTNSTVYLDAVEVLVEKARRFWWGQQLELSMIPFSVFLTIEGRRRAVPFLWAYLALGHLVSHSFGQTLFYIAMIVTPLPLGQTSSSSGVLSRLLPEKPGAWRLHTCVLFGISALNYFLLLLVPLVAGTKTFSTVLLMLKACSFLPLLVTALFPRKWGKEFARSSDDTHSLNILFQALAVASLVFHVKTTAAGLLFNLPNSHRHRHFISIPFDIEKRSTLERSTTAMGKILGSMSDHPVVAGAAADVLLTTLGLGLWSAFGSVDVGTMLASAVPGYRRVSRGLLACKHELQDTVTSHPAESIVADTASSASHLSRRLRGRQSASDTVHKSNPSVQDEGETASKPKRRGRPRKVKREEETMVEEPGDGAYQPPAADVGSSCQGGAMLEEDPDWEAAALSWGLVALAGLGTGSTAVFGAECVPP